MAETLKAWIKGSSSSRIASLVSSNFMPKYRSMVRTDLWPRSHCRFVNMMPWL